MSPLNIVYRKESATQEKDNEDLQSSCFQGELHIHKIRNLVVRDENTVAPLLGVYLLYPILPILLSRNLLDC
jgi:hypothetical protein